MADGKGRVWFITGSSTGFGRSLALEIVKRGEKVAATARNPGAIDPALKGSNQVITPALDVTDPVACQRAVDETLAKWGRIDVLVNNAGYGLVGAVEEVSDAEARQLYDCNVFGVLNMCRATLPAMRKARMGHIVNIDSVGDLLGRAGFAIYGSSMFAVEGITEGLYHEMKPLGIKVTVVEPGTFRTDFGGRSMTEAKKVFDDYDGTAGEWRRSSRVNSGKQPGDPDKEARAIIAAVDAANPPLHLVVGTMAMTRTAEKLKALLAEIDTWCEVRAAPSFD